MSKSFPDALKNALDGPAFILYFLPISGEIKFYKELLEEYKWYIIDQRGLNLATGNILPEKTSVEFDASELPSGINHLILVNEYGKFYIFKFIMLH